MGASISTFQSSDTDHLILWLRSAARNADGAMRALTERHGPKNSEAYIKRVDHALAQIPISMNPETATLRRIELARADWDEWCLSKDADTVSLPALAIKTARDVAIHEQYETSGTVRREKRTVKLWLTEAVRESRAVEVALAKRWEAPCATHVGRVSAALDHLPVRMMPEDGLEAQIEVARQEWAQWSVMMDVDSLGLAVNSIKLARDMSAGRSRPTSWSQ